MYGVSSHNTYLAVSRLQSHQWPPRTPPGMLQQPGPLLEVCACLEQAGLLKCVCIAAAPLQILCRSHIVDVFLSVCTAFRNCWEAWLRVANAILVLTTALRPCINLWATCSGLMAPA
jgi:hypothetical protein